MLTLKKIAIKNFLSTGQNALKFDLDKHKTTLLSGKNGAGKSTLVDAICFALYGKAFRNINKPQLVNLVNKKNCLVCLEFSVGNTEYKIFRGMKPTVFQIYKDDVLIDQDASSRDYQEMFERDIVRMSHSTFCQIVVLGNANWTAFMSLSAIERRKVLEDMLNIEIFGVMSTLLKERVSDVKAMMRDENERIAVLNNTIEMNEKHNSDNQKRADDIVAKKKEKIAEYREEILAAELQKESLNAKIAEIDEKCKRIEVFEDRISDGEVKSKHIEGMMKQSMDHIEFYNDNASCPTCKQDLDAKFRDLMTKQEEIKYGKMSDQNQQLTDELIELGKTLHKYKQLARIGMQYQTKLQQVNAQVESLNNVITYALEDIEKTLQPVSVVDNHDYQQDLQKALAGKSKLLQMQELNALATTMLKDDGIKAKIIKQYIPVINTLVNRYLERMEFFVKFHLNENFDMEIRALHKEDMSYDSFSQGEKMRIDLAILFTWRDIIRQKKMSHCNLLILDEIMDSSLDAQGTDDFLDVIRALTPDNNVFIISHKQDQISDRFECVLEIEKRKNFSKVRK